MKLASVGIDPNPVGFAADNVSIHDPTELLEISFYWQFYYAARNETPGFFNSPTLKKLVSVGIDRDHVGFAATVSIRSHWAIEDIIYSVFYYVILEMQVC